MIKNTLLLMLLLNSLTILADKPNIVYILADDMGIGDISGLNTQSKIRTPQLDSLINNGMTFTDAHTASAVCTPTRYGLLTGRYPWRSELKDGVTNGYSKALISENLDTVPKLLKRAGYNTAMVGKWHLGFNWTFKEGAKAIYDLKPDSRELEDQVDYTKPFTGGPIDCGFDYFYGMVASPGMPPYTYLENRNVTVQPTERQEWFGPRPKFPGGKKMDFERKAQMLRPGYKAPGFESNQVMLTYTEKAVEYIDKYSSEKPFFLYVPYASPHTPIFPRKPFLGTSQAGIYGDFVEELDWSVGQIIKALKDSGKIENTLIIFTADNGYAKAGFPQEHIDKYKHEPSRELNGRKASLLEGGHRVPFIAHWPKIIKQKSQCSTAVSLNDLYATCAQMTGIKTELNQGVDSYNMLDLLKGGELYERPNMIYADYSGKFAIRKGDWKLILNPNPKMRALYNLKNDLSEKTNQYTNPEFKSVVDELMKTITQVVQNGRTTNGKVLKNDGPEKWQQLYWIK